jgi:hypothetical protein
MTDEGKVEMLCDAIRDGLRRGYNEHEMYNACYIALNTAMVRGYMLLQGYNECIHFYVETTAQHGYKLSYDPDLKVERL